jgi:hypothetical protein
MFESFVDSDGVNIWTTRTGGGYPVMLCNGGAGCCDYLAPVAEMLDDRAQGALLGRGFSADLRVGACPTGGGADLHRGRQNPQ